MSEEVTKQADQQAATLPDPDAAYSHLFDQVHARIFFTKLGQAGYTPRNEKEAQEMLELAGKLRMVRQDPAVKQAADDSGRFAQANQALDTVLGQHGMDGSIKQASAQEQDVALDQAVDLLAQDHNIYNSVLSLKAAEAQGYRDEFAGVGQGQQPDC